MFRGWKLDVNMDFSVKDTHRQSVVKQVQPKKVITSVGRPDVVGPPSYAKVVRGDNDNLKSGEKSAKREEATPSLTIDDEVIRDDSFPYAWLGCYKDFRAIANTRSMCQGEGFRDVHPVYLGGLWVLLDFQLVETRDNFVNHAAFKNWFDILQPWFNNFVVKERILWVEVEGVPLLAWCRSTFEEIASKWGRLIFIDDSDVSNRFSIRLGILSLHAPLVFESVFVTIQDVEYCVRVRELSSWTPSFIAGFSDEDGDGSNYGDDRHDGDGDDSVKSCQEVDQHEEGFQKEEVVVLSPKKGGAEKVDDGAFVEEEVVKAEEEVVKAEDSDPFNLGQLIEHFGGQKGDGDDVRLASEGDLLGPPGFTSKIRAEDAAVERGVPTTPVHGDGTRTPTVMADFLANDLGQPTSNGDPDLVDVEVRQVEARQLPPMKPFSIVEKLDSAIAVGLALGWDMSGCIRNLEEIIMENGVSTVHQ
ncbi:hypothetical protein LXL04_038174 [Taraxacum kok-saghyz]